MPSTWAECGNKMGGWVPFVVIVTVRMKQMSEAVLNLPIHSQVVFMFTSTMWGRLVGGRMSAQPSPLQTKQNVKDTCFHGLLGHMWAIYVLLMERLP